jgi:hypothetical protein
VALAAAHAVRPGYTADRRFFLAAFDSQTYTSKKSLSAYAMPPVAQYYRFFEAAHFDAHCTCMTTK